MAWDINTRNRLPALGLAIYGASTLTYMAGMSVGAAALAACMLGTPGIGKAFAETFRQIRRDPAARHFAWASSALIMAILLSLGAALLFPAIYNKVPIRPTWQGLGKLWYLLWPFVLATAWKVCTPDQRIGALKSWWWAFALISLLAIPEFFWGWPRPQGNPDLPPFHHPVLLLGHHLSVASVWIFPFFITLDAAVRRRWDVVAPRWAQALSLLLGLAILILLYSRMLWIALPIGLSAWVISTLPRRWAAAAVAAIVVTAALATQLPAVQRRWNTYVGRGDRWNLWAAHTQVFQDHPVTGVGFMGPQEAVRQYYSQNNPNQTDFFVGHAHNLFLETLTGTGVLGGLALLAWFFTLLRLAYLPQAASPAVPAGVLCALLVFLLNGLTQVNLWEGKVLHQVTWIAGWVLSWRLGRKTSA